MCVVRTRARERDGRCASSAQTSGVETRVVCVDAVSCEELLEEALIDTTSGLFGKFYKARACVNLWCIISWTTDTKDEKVNVCDVS